MSIPDYAKDYLLGRPWLTEVELKLRNDHKESEGYNGGKRT